MIHSEPVGPIVPVLKKCPLLRCESEYGALFCLTCNNGFPRKRIIRHLNNRHRFTIDLYRPALRPFECEALAEEWKNLLRPVDRSAPIEGLNIHTGYACMRCGLRTTSDHVVKKHLKCEPVHRVHLQYWNPNDAPQYWIVVLPPMTKHAAVNGLSTSEAGSCILLLQYSFFN